MPEPGTPPATPEEFQALRRAAGGMSTFPDPAVALSLERTLHGVWLREGGAELIAMGRLTGDGGACFVQVNDVAVHPDWQGGQGLGTQVMDGLMAWAEANLPKGCYISLIADAGGAERLYEKAGFALRTGMARVLR